MRKRWQLLAALVLLGIAALVGPRLWRGKSGPSSLYGGSLEPIALVDFPSLGADRWINGAPLSLSAAHGSVVLIEAWHPT
jgi:hypothetical protein